MTRYWRLEKRARAEALYDRAAELSLAAHQIEAVGHPELAETIRAEQYALTDEGLRLEIEAESK